VVVSVSTDFVVEIPEDEHFVVEGLEGFENGFVIEVLPQPVRPETFGDSAIGAEHNNQALFGSFLGLV
jgi:hypothetical protein